MVREDEALAANDRGEAALWDQALDGIPVSFLTWKGREQDRVVQALRQAVMAAWT